MSSPFRPIAFLFAVIIALLLVSFYRKTIEPGQMDNWLTDLPQAQEESRRTGKPILAYFTADWCPPCQEMKRTTFPDPSVQAALQEYVPLAIDLTQGPNDLARQYRATPIPTFIILDASGQTQRRTFGPYSPAEFVEWLGRKPAS